MFTIVRTAWLPTPGPVTIIAGRLPQRSWRSLVRVLAWTHRVRRALAVSPGLVGYQFGYDIRASALWTVSAWSTRTGLIHFERSEVHRSAMAALRPFLLPSDFVVWTTDGAGRPCGWDDVRRRIRAVENR